MALAAFFSVTTTLVSSATPAPPPTTQAAKARPHTQERRHPDGELPADRQQPAFDLADWMGALAPVIGDMSLLDLSLPGTHDSMTYNLSTRVADNGNDLPPWLTWVLHQLGPLVDRVKLGALTRAQATTQWLDMTGQLDAGARFIDFRTTYTAPPDGGSFAAYDWFGVHLVETQRRSVRMLVEARAFLEAHPREILLIWISRHGNPCATGQEQYPGATPAKKQAFWAQIKATFAGMLYVRPARGGGVNATTVNEMVASGRRVVVYASDYKEFTGSDPEAYDACMHVHNALRGGALNNPRAALGALGKELRTAAARRAALKATDSLYLVSLAGSPPWGVVQRAVEVCMCMCVWWVCMVHVECVMWRGEGVRRRV